MPTTIRSEIRNFTRGLTSPLVGGGGGLLDFIPPAQRTGGFAAGLSRLFGSYSGALVDFRRGSDSVELDAGSGATRVSSSDVTGFVGKNLLSYSEDLTNAVWANLVGGTGTAPVKTPGFVGPDGQPAFRVQCTVGASPTTNDYSLVRQNFVGLPSPRTVSLGFWVKSNTGASQNMMFHESSSFSGTIVFAVTPSWQFIPVTHTVVSASSGFQIGLRGGYLASTSLDILVCEPQLEYGPSATTYEARTTTGASPCYVPKLYDQIGSNHAIQNTGTLQPQIIPRQIGEWPILVGDGVDDVLRVAGFMATLNAKDVTVIQAGRNALCGNSAASRLYVGGAASSYDLADNLAHGNSGNRRVLSLRSEGAAQSARINGTVAATATQAQIATYGGTDFLLGQAGSVYGNPPQSTLVFPSALDPTTLAAIEAKLMTEYQITP